MVNMSLNKDVQRHVCGFLPLNAEFFETRPLCLAESLGIPLQLIWDKAQMTSSHCRRELAEKKDQRDAQGGLLVQPIGLDVIMVVDEFADGIFANVIKKLPRRVLERVGIFPSQDASFAYPSVAITREILLSGAHALKEDTRWVGRLTEDELISVFHTLIETNHLTLLKALIQNPRIQGLSEDNFSKELFHSLDEGSNESAAFLLEQPTTKLHMASPTFNFEKCIRLALQRENFFVLEELLSHPRMTTISAGCIQRILQTLDHFQSVDLILRKKEFFSALLQNPNFWQMEASFVCFLLEHAMGSSEFREEIDKVFASSIWNQFPPELKKNLVYMLCKYERLDLARAKIISEADTLFTEDQTRTFLHFFEHPACRALQKACKENDLSLASQVFEDPVFREDPRLSLMVLRDQIHKSSDEMMVLLLSKECFHSALMQANETQDEELRYTSLLMVAKFRPSLVVLEKLALHPLFLTCQKDLLSTILSAEYFGHRISEVIFEHHPIIIQRMSENIHFLDDLRLIIDFLAFLVQRVELAPTAKRLLQDPRFLQFLPRALKKVATLLEGRQEYKEELEIINRKLSEYQT